MTKVLLLILISVVSGFAQTGTIVQTTLTTVVASSTDVAPAQIVCQFSNPARPTVHTVCSQAETVVLTMDSTPAIGAMNGATGSINLSGHAITWLIQQPTANVINWQIAADGATANGVF